MSAIVGVVNLAGEAIDGSVPKLMLGTMPHRCADGEDAWAGGPIALGHGKRYTTPESLKEVLPLRHPDLPVALTADARIDNREDLIRALEWRSDAVGVSDSRLILESYLRWGPRCVEELVGDFAFAVWDGRTRTLFCARDVFGARPFYYTRVGGEFAFATEIKALLALPAFEPRLNEQRVADLLSVNRDEPEHTMYEGVWRLPAAHTLTLKLGRIGGAAPHVRRYYTFEPRPEASRRSDDSYVEELQDRFREAVKCRLRSAFPIGVQLSGGLDSSSVAAVARDLLRQEGRLPLTTLSLTFDALPAADEREYVEPIVAQGGLDPHYVPGDTTGPLSNVARLAPYLDDGPSTGTQNLVWAMLLRGQELGVRVMLDGIDGDNTISHGELYLRELLRAGDWEGFLREARAVTRRYSEADHRQDFQDFYASEAALLHGTVLAHLVEMADRGRPLRFLREVQAAHRHIGLGRSQPLRQFGRRAFTPRAFRKLWRPPSTRPNPQLVEPGFAKRIGLAERLEQYDLLVPHTTVREAQAVLLGSTRIASAVEIANHYAASVGIELRHPFFDRRLTEFTLSLPGDLSLRDGWTRYILRRAMADLLPQRVAWRVGKASMLGVHERGLLEIDRALVLRVLKDLGPIEPYVNVSYVRTLAERLDHLSTEERMQLDTVCNLSLWFHTRYEMQRGGLAGV